MLNDRSYRREPVSESGSSSHLLGAFAMVIRCRREQEIYSQGDSAENAYRVVEGAARRFAIQPNGRRRIVDFLLPGDFFGFAAEAKHAFAVQAVNATTSLARYERRGLERLGDSDPRVARAIRAATGQEISRLQARVLLLGRITALAKVSGFLLEMARRCAGGATDRVADRIVLPMSRYDVADYLALSVETVSRAMTVLKQRGAIELTGTRQVRIVEPTVLDDMDDTDEGRRWDWPSPSSGGGDRRQRITA